MSWQLGATPPNMDPGSVVRIDRPKSPGDQCVINCDFRGALAGIDNDTLDTTFIPGTTVERNDDGPPDCYVTGTPAIGEFNTRVAVWLAAGTAGFEYLVSVSVKSVAGEYFTRSFIMPVMLR